MIDQQQVVALALLDLSAAFDTCDHDIFLNRLQTDFGIEGIALEWFQSYLSNHKQSVKIRESISDAVSLDPGWVGDGPGHVQ